jgi:RNA polymerase sigma-70 factor (ECF subfamily)
MDEPLHAWFKREILCHEEMLMRFLIRVWPRRDEHADIRQETYARVFESARKNRPQMPKAFLFATARHLMADRIRRERIVSIKAGGESDFLNVLVDEMTPERRVSGTEELTKLARALDRLPPKCRQIFWLRRVQDIPQKQLADRFGVTEKAIEKQLTAGTRLVTQYMRLNMLSAGRDVNQPDTLNVDDLDEMKNEQGKHGPD